MALLPRLSLLSLLCVTANGRMFQSALTEHAQLPLRTIEAVARRTQCALWCRWTHGCVNWSYDPDSLLCRLWPVSSVDNPLTTTQEEVFQRTPPNGFTISDDPKIAYTQHSFTPTVGGSQSLTSLCQRDHPDAFPAFPNSEQKVTYIKDHAIGKYFFVGIHRGSDGIWRDMTTGESVDLLATWFWNLKTDGDVSNDCVTLYYRGFWAVPCTDLREGYICQYNMLDQTAAPPEGFVISDNPTIAYRQHSLDLISDRASFASLCQQHDVDAVPAFPSTEQQVTYIKQNVIDVYFYVGIYRTSDGIWRDMTTDVAVDVLPAWFWDGIADGDVSNDCMTLYEEGFWAVPCTDQREGYICQFNL